MAGTDCPYPAETGRSRPRSLAAGERGIVACGLIGLVLSLIQLLVPAFNPPIPASAPMQRLAAGMVRTIAAAPEIRCAVPIDRLARPSALIAGYGGVEGSLRLYGYRGGWRDASLALSGVQSLVNRLETQTEPQYAMRAPVLRNAVVMPVDKTAVHPQDHRVLARIAGLFQRGKDKIVFKPSETQTLAYDAKSLKLDGGGRATGNLSAKYESGSAQNQAIGYSVSGGTCYGTYQIASRTGTLSQFFKLLEVKAPDWAERLRNAGSADTGGIKGAMPETWKSIAEEDPRRFAALQHEFIDKTHYQPAVRQIYEQTGANIATYSQAVREVLWSAAVQHGPSGATSMFCQALAELKNNRLTPANGREYEKALIEAVYRQRQKNYQDAPLMLRASLAMRYDREKSHALGLLMAGPKKPGKLLVIGSKAGEDS